MMKKPTSVAERPVLRDETKERKISDEPVRQAFTVFPLDYKPQLLDL